MAVELIGKQCNILGYRKYKGKNTEYRKINYLQAFYRLQTTQPHTLTYTYTHTKIIMYAIEIN